LRIIEDWVTQNAPGFTTFHTHVSIDVVPPGLSKKEGLVWLAEKTGVSLDEIAFIGDTNGDIAALESVGRSFAPANAQPQVKNVVHHICSGTDIQGVIEAYRLCMG
jgi:hydroxymethylpyrimidine pyrophosphatase-like HAD family hydrolase